MIPNAARCYPDGRLMHPTVLESQTCDLCGGAVRDHRPVRLPNGRVTFKPVFVGIREGPGSGTWCMLCDWAIRGLELVTTRDGKEIKQELVRVDLLSSLEQDVADRRIAPAIRMQYRNILARARRLQARNP